MHNRYLAHAQDEYKNGSNLLGNSLIPLPQENCIRAIYPFGELVLKISEYSIGKLPEQKKIQNELVSEIVEGGQSTNLMMIEVIGLCQLLHGII